MSFATRYIALFTLLLLACSTQPEVIVEPRVIAPVAISAGAENTIAVEEANIPTPLSDYSLSEEGLTFTNRNRDSYSAPTERLHTKEPENTTYFIINKGHYVLLEKNEINWILRYEGIDTRRKEIIFNLTSLEEQRFRAPYGSSSTTQALTSDPHSIRPGSTLANDDILGQGIITLEGYTFPFTVSYRAGNPLAIDFNGDYQMDGARMNVHTKNGNTYEVQGVR